MLSPDQLQKFFEWFIPNASFSMKIMIRYHLGLNEFVTETYNFFFMTVP